MNRRLYNLFMLLLLIAVAALTSCADDREPVDEYTAVDISASISPDYSGIAVPPNIAPLNFMIKEPAEKYHVKISSAKGDAIEISSLTGKIIIPQKQWKSLLKLNAGNDLILDVYTKDSAGAWTRYKPIVNSIAKEAIDGFIVYRKMDATYVHFKGLMAIYCRDLSGYGEKLILNNKSLKRGCLNCHSFANNSPDKMVLGIRSYRGTGASTLLVEDKKVSKLDTKFGYTSWHPSGRLAAYSIDMLPMMYHAYRTETRDTIGVNSLIAYYLLDSKTVKIVEPFARKERLETWPSWSADGKYLYSCNAPKLWEGDQYKAAAACYKDVKYDLVRASYDIESDKWGRLETLISAKETDMSVSMPRTSPDGRWLTFCMTDYGYFAPWNPTSDIYMIDLKNRNNDYKKLSLSSDKSEGWRSFSSNSKWIAFSSKRDNGVFTRTYFSYIDDNGNSSKPFVMPQKDPAYYDSCLETYTIPELITDAVTSVGNALSGAIRGSKKIAIDMPITMATPKEDTAEQEKNYEQN